MSLEVLIVDDSPEDREIFRRYLARSEGKYRFLEAETGREGLDLFRKGRPDCILLDYLLPDIDGLEFLEQLQAGEEMLPAAVVMLTGQGSEQVAVEAMRSGVQDYLVKDHIRPDSLPRSIQNAVEKYHLQRRLQESRRELEISNARLRQFAAILSHDLRAPARQIRQFSELLQQSRGNELSGEGLEYLHGVRKAARRMEEMIDALLDYCRVTANPRSFIPVDLAEVVQEVVADLEAALSETGGTVTWGDLPTLQADRILLWQLLHNLVDNALKYCREGEPLRVEVRSRLEGDEYVLEVAENGTGFAEEDAERIFLPFRRLVETSNRPGTGMGLAICRRIAEHHGGSITARSRPGEGSVFTVRLPVRVREEP